MSFFSFFLDLIFPPQCLNCKNETGGAGGLCGDCYAKIKFISDPVCVCCGKPFLPEESLYTHCGVCLAKRPFFTAAKSIFQYDDASKHMILAYKHMDQTHLSRFLSGLILKTQFDFCVGCDVIVPVPLHWSRLMKRKYNQSAFIARDIAKKTGKVYAPTAIIRYKKTKSQGHLSPKLREKNIKNAFTANPKIDVLGKKILLVDDVYTTGITANECAKVLVKAGASGVYVITLARVVKG